MQLRRRELILKYTVEHFVKTAVPVGSNTLLENLKLLIAVRQFVAEMNALEEAGFFRKNTYFKWQSTLVVKAMSITSNIFVVKKLMKT